LHLSWEKLVVDRNVITKKDSKGERKKENTE
jgi:hypothetical protein